MKYFRECSMCKGTGYVLNDSYCANVNGVLDKKCPDCNGSRLIDCTDEVVELIESNKKRNQLLISTQCFIDELKVFGIIK